MTPSPQTVIPPILLNSTTHHHQRHRTSSHQTITCLHLQLPRGEATVSPSSFLIVIVVVLHSFPCLIDFSLHSLAALPPAASQDGLPTDPATSNSHRPSSHSSALVHTLTVLYQSLSALGPDMYTTLPSILTSPLKTLRRHRLARLRAEGGNIDTSLQSSSRQYSQVHVCSPHFEMFEALTIYRRH